MRKSQVVAWGCCSYCCLVSFSSGFTLSKPRKPIGQRRRRTNIGNPHSSSVYWPRYVLNTPEAIIEQASTTKLLDDLIDESVRTSARRPIMMQFDPSSGWIWQRWKGTVFAVTWDACVYRMIYACAIYIVLCSVCSSGSSNSSTAVGLFPDLKDTLAGFSILWAQLLSVTTFTLTFFVNQSYAMWRKCCDCSRSLQGRLHDLGMMLAAHATRTTSTMSVTASTENQSTPRSSSTSTTTTCYTPESRQLLELFSRYVRLFHLLAYASFTRSHRPVLTPRGMRRLVERGLMTPLERQVLVQTFPVSTTTSSTSGSSSSSSTATSTSSNNFDILPPTQRHNVVLLWMIRACIEGLAAGHLRGGAGLEQQLIEKVHWCRSAYGAIGGELQGRMPLAYAHIVQVLVDVVLVLYPVMAYSSGMSLFVCVLGTALLTIGYQGLVRILCVRACVRACVAVVQKPVLTFFLRHLHLKYTPTGTSWI
jgi:Bestrophin, RFP-TM, chloride channel